MPTFKFSPNVPAPVELGYIDIVPSEKGGPQIRFKGKIGGEDKVYAYLPGKLDANLATLIAAGIIANQQYPTEVEKPSEVKPLKKQFTAVVELIPPAKYGTFKIVGSNGASAASPTPAPSGAPPVTKSYSELYGKATDYILNTILPKYKTAGKAVETTDVVAMVRDLFNAKTNAI